MRDSKSRPLLTWNPSLSLPHHSARGQRHITPGAYKLHRINTGIDRYGHHGDGVHAFSIALSGSSRENFPVLVFKALGSGRRTFKFLVKLGIMLHVGFG